MRVTMQELRKFVEDFVERETQKTRKKLTNSFNSLRDRALQQVTQTRAKKPGREKLQHLVRLHNIFKEMSDTFPLTAVRKATGVSSAQKIQNIIVKNALFQAKRFLKRAHERNPGGASYYLASHVSGALSHLSKVEEYTSYEKLKPVFEKFGVSHDHIRDVYHGDTDRLTLPEGFFDELGAVEKALANPDTKESQAVLAQYDI